MTEAAWLAATTSLPMLDWLADRTPRPSDRKWRLLLAGCARQVWDQIPPGPKREAVETAERCADGDGSQEEVAKARAEYYTVDEGLRSAGMSGWNIHAIAYASCTSERRLARPHWTTHWGGVSALAGERLPGLLRCVFGSPFRRVEVEPSWLTPHTLPLANGIYADRAFDRLPLLADALRDAGCDDPAVLAHCRAEGPHVRGCWVVDLLLRKE